MYRWILGFLCATVGASAAPTFDDVTRTVFRPKCFECHRDPGAAAGLDLSSHKAILAHDVVTPGKPDSSLLVEKVTTGEMPLVGDALTESEIALIRDWISAGALDSPPVQGPALKNVTPAFGPTTGGTVVTLTGEHLGRTTEVAFDDDACTNLQIVSETEVRCTTPAVPRLGSVTVRLRSEDGETALEGGYEYRVPLGPTYEALFANVLKPRCLKCHNDEKPSHGLSMESYRALRSHRRAVIPYDLKRSRIYKKVREGEMPRGGPRLSREEIAVIGDWILKGAPER